MTEEATSYSEDKEAEFQKALDVVREHMEYQKEVIKYASEDDRAAVIDNLRADGKIRRGLRVRIEHIYNIEPDGVNDIIAAHSVLAGLSDEDFEWELLRLPDVVSGLIAQGALEHIARTAESRIQVRCEEAAPKREMDAALVKYLEQNRAAELIKKLAETDDVDDGTM